MTLRGVVCGKFWPPHSGHQYLIERALNGCDQLYIMVIQRDWETPTGEQRREWLENWYPQAIVRLTDDTIQDNPDTYSDNHENWAIKTKEVLGITPDVVFSSEQYGIGWAAAMGAEHVMVDEQREVEYISGTEIRLDPYLHWHQMHPDIRAYYTKRIVIVGPESCGKTTLARNLAKRLRTVWVPEWARIYGEELNYGPDDWEDDGMLFEHIAINQPMLEQDLATKASTTLICDTDLLTTSIWAETYGNANKETVEYVRGLHDAWRKIHPYSLYLLCLPDVPWVQDGGRNRGEENPKTIGSRPWFVGRFREELAEREEKVVEISGPDWADRDSQALNAIMELFE